MASTPNETDVLQSIAAKLDQLLRLTALQMASGMKQVQAIQTLTAAGFDRRVIAELLGTTPNTVSVTLAKVKAKQKSREIPVIDPATLTPTTE